MNDICWSCSRSSYHDYKDKHGIRCPSCGQKEKDDPKKVVKTELVDRLPQVAPKPAAKRTVRSK